MNEIDKVNLISYADAILQATDQALALESKVFIMGQLVDYAPGVFGTTTKLVEKYGESRIRDFPVSESAMTSAAIGAAVTGMRPVLVHHRLDFMIYAMDAIVNWMALWRFKSNGVCSLPLVIRAVVGKGWGQGPQHSKSLHSWFAHIPGISVVMPSTAYDVKGMLLEAIFSENPVIFIEHRSLFGIKDFVPEAPYRVKLGKALVRKVGQDITMVSMGIMVGFAERVSDKLLEYGISAEVIDLRSISPLDLDTIFTSISKTKRLCVLEPGWESFSVSSEIISRVAENKNLHLDSPPIRIAYPNSHTPMSGALEEAYYPKELDAVDKIKQLILNN
jgi:pyruvate/2-oxoglutarate/acetoin dehydrogenase E1 component